MATKQKYEYGGFEFEQPPTAAQKKVADYWAPYLRASQLGTIEHYIDESRRMNQISWDFKQIEKVSESEEELNLRKDYRISPTRETKEKLLDCLAKKAANQASDKEYERMIRQGYRLDKDYCLIAESSNAAYSKGRDEFWRRYRIYGDEILDPYR